ncbi:hypothetical protein EVAR_51442_1 [Eumeta japonica]|uniref:Uncharacterized protein n=1 Tax=Eumeta variegata TaxID=151549 RepID=A0A4C1XR84_EUMVA|nr:hypothetical protein EVAR_51442_1 [Eumeta japonica]
MGSVSTQMSMRVTKEQVVTVARDTCKLRSHQCISGLFGSNRNLMRRKGRRDASASGVMKRKMGHQNTLTGRNTTAKAIT